MTWMNLQDIAVQPAWDLCVLMYVCVSIDDPLLHEIEC